jgi:uncharacterized protein YoxC
MTTPGGQRLTRKVNKHDEDLRAHGDTTDKIKTAVDGHTRSLDRIDRIDRAVAAVESKVDR